MVPGALDSVRGVLRGVLDLALAPVCAGCRRPVPSGGQGDLVCGLCQARVRSLPDPKCDRCWTPLPLPVAGVTASCRVCPELRPAVRAVRSAFLLDEVSRPLVHALKYRGWHRAAALMGRRMAAVPWPREVDSEAELVVPVPLTRVRRRERGYNQAEALASEIALQRGWRLAPELLERARAAGSQTALHPSERRANVAGVFRVPENAAGLLVTRHIVVVDDVWTTGATALSCADALLAAGARAVSILTFARALPDIEGNVRRAELARR
ncbi:MAG: ComF family protein [Gemmatimonadota bacterium]|jgi:ComF family protein|nr:ComF family protein [Gemmatimonadota bacterium]